MTVPLSPNIAKAVERLFPSANREQVIQLLTEQCADNLPNSEGEDEYELEDRRFQVLKLSEGDVEKLRDAIRMAQADWRDLMGAAGPVEKYKRDLLGEDLERNPSSAWVQRGIYLNVLTAIVAFLLPFILWVTEVPILTSATVMLAVAAAYMTYIFVLFWSDENSRKNIGFGGALAMMLLAAVQYVGLPAAIAAVIIRFLL